MAKTAGRAKPSDSSRQETALAELVSPLLDDTRHRPTRAIVVGALVFAAVAVIGISVTLFRSSAPTPHTADETLIDSVTTADQQSAPERVVLIDANLDDPYLHQPTLIPSGWMLCRDSPIRTTVCGPDESNEITVEVLRASAAQVGVMPVPDAAGWTMTRLGTRVEVYIPLPSQRVLRVLPTGLHSDDVVAIVRSIPMAGSRDSLYAPYEPGQLNVEDITDDQFAGLFDPGETVRVVRTGTGINEHAVIHVRSDTEPDLRLGVQAHYTRGLLEVAGGLSAPRLVNGASRPMLIGSFEGGEGRLQVWWIQYGLTWEIITGRDEASVAHLAVAIEAAIDLLGEQLIG